MRRVLSLTALVGMSLVIALALVELMLRVFASQLPPAVATNAGIVTQSNIGVERFRRAWASSLIVDPNLGIHSAANVDAVLTGHPDFSFHLQTDASGFRNRHSEGPVDVVAIGDSFTFGYGVDYQDSWTALLEQNTGWTVANLGQAGFGPQGELEILETEGLRLRPRLVVWQFFANDFLDAGMFDQWQRAGKPNRWQWEAQLLATERETDAHEGILTGLRGLLHRNLVSYELVKYVLGVGSYRTVRSQQVPVIVNGSRLYLNRAQLDGWTNPDWSAISEGRELTETALLQARQATEAAGASFVVLLIPSKEEVLRNWLGDEANQDPWSRPRNSQHLLEFCQREGFTCFDGYDAMEQTVTQGGAAPYFSHDGHMNAAGHKVIADELSARLADEFVRD